MKLKSPCLDCGKRYPGCQGECLLGIAYIESLKQRNDQIKAERAKESESTTYHVESINRVKARVER